MAAPATKRRTPNGTVRIIGGRWKRTPLPVGDAPGLRPTPDRVRETVFNWLAHALGDFAGRSFLDLYAGSGALGFEAASRGAERVVLVDNHPRTAASLRATQAKLDAQHVEIASGDATHVVGRLAAAGRTFDVVFLDPPFGQGLLDAALSLAVRVCRPDGFIYVESDARMPDPIAAAVGLEPFRADRAGEVFYHLLQCKKTE